MRHTMRQAMTMGGVVLVGGLITRRLMRMSRWVSLKDQIVIVTGGSRGLGLCLARELAEMGAKVVICARTVDQLETAQQELESLSRDVVAIPCDVRDQASVQEMVAQVVERFGQVNVLINVAGIIEVGPMDAMTLEDFHDSMDTNCWGALHTVLAVLPEMRRQGWGRIVNVASLGGKRAVPHLLPYAVSKFALVGLSNGLWTELIKENILVSTVCPSLMNTGSPRNATFKGQHEKEYAWFSIGDSIPGISMNARAAARQIIQACQYGDREVLIRNPVNLAIFAQQFFPGLTQELLSVMDRLLPAMGGIGQQAAKGYESQSIWSPSWLTAFGEAAARRNNEMHKPDRPHLHRN